MQFFKYLKLTRMVKKIVKDENLLENLSKLYGFNFHIDNIGRIYAVINPLIKRGVYDVASQKYGVDDSIGVNQKEFMNNWVISRLDIAQEFIFEKNLFNILTYTIDPIDDKNNFLLVMSPLGYEEFKSTLKGIGIFLAICLICLIVFLFL